MNVDFSAKLLSIIQDCLSTSKYKPTPEEITPEPGVFNGGTISFYACNKLGPANGFTITEEDSWGGEDKGSDYGFVFKFSRDTVEFYLKCKGYYSSWEDTEWYESFLVAPKPRQVTVIDWISDHDNPLSDSPELLL